MENMRNYTFFDHCLMALQESVHTLFTTSVSQNYPARGIKNPDLDNGERRQSSGFMRVNHAGEVCAQALYRGQAVFSKSPQVRGMLERAALEETDHLNWCHERLQELNSHRSYLNPFWYWNSFLMGLVTGYVGDAWSLGFVEETEKQVTQHLQHHLNHLPQNDDKSRTIVEHMQKDEMRHGEHAKKCGAKALPFPIKKLMTLHAKVMTTLAYWI